MQVIEYPTIQLGGKTYYLRVSLASLRRLKEFGATKPPDANDKSFENQIATGHYFACNVAACSYVATGNNGDLVAAGMTVEQAEELIDPWMIEKLRDKLDEAVEKARQGASSPARPAVS
jgi:hypothetical protein